MASREVSAYPVATWRLIVDGEADGATNMAVDQAILNAVVEGASRPTLRFYGWSPPCLSLGRSQPYDDVSLQRCLADGVDVVRRPTGGRAILHTDDDRMVRLDLQFQIPPTAAPCLRRSA